MSEDKYSLMAQTTLSKIFNQYCSDQKVLTYLWELLNLNDYVEKYIQNDDVHSIISIIGNISFRQLEMEDLDKI